MNKEVLNKVDEIIKEIEGSSEYQKYLILKDKISQDKKLMELINKVRVMQKDVLHKKKSKEELDQLLNELNTHPLYLEYNNIIYEINNTFAIIENNLNNYFDQLMN